MVSRAWRASVWALCVAFAGATLAGCDQPTEPAPPCSLSISPASASLPPDGGTAVVAVSASGATCAWTAVSNAAWLTILEGASGTGAGTVRYQATANASATSRSGAITLNGLAHVVEQSGRPQTPCTYALTPESATIDDDGGAGTIAVGARADCAWSAISSAPWLTITSGQTGTGNGVVTYQVAANATPFIRTAAIAVADRLFTLTQTGESLTCDFVVAPVLFTPCLGSGVVTATVSVQPFCPWTASSTAGWLVVTNGASGEGPGTIVASFGSNYDAPRDAIIQVRWPFPTAGQNIRVSQAGCLYAVSRSTISVPATGGSASFDVLQQAMPNVCGGPLQDACIWTAAADAPWITITSSMPRRGDQPVAFQVAANPDPAARTGTITVADRHVTVTQAGR